VAGTGGKSGPPPVTLSIVGTNDLHGELEGLPWFAGYLASLRRARARDGGAVILVDAGDLLHGTLASNAVEGEVVIRAYNALGYSAAAIGNHELDFGPAALRARARQAKFPFLAANLANGDGTALRWPNVHPSVLIEQGGVKVGIVGVTLPALARASAPDTVGDLRLSPSGEAIAVEAARLRGRGAAVVVAAAHEGGHCADLQAPDDLTSCQDDSPVFELARALPPGLVDVIVAGHTHRAVAHRVNGVAIIESYARGRAFGRVDLIVNRGRGGVVARIFPPQAICRPGSDQPAPRPCRPAVYEGAPVEPVPEMVALVETALRRVRSRSDESLGVATTRPIRRAHARESALGNLFADLLLATTPGGDVAVVGPASVRADLPRGALTYGTLHRALPFDSRAATLTMTAGDLARAIGQRLRHGRLTVSLSGLRAQARCHRGRPFLELRRPDGRAIPPHVPLRVVTSEYLAAAGGGLFAGATPDAVAAVPLRDLIARGLRERGDVIGDGEIRALGRTRVEHPGGVAGIGRCL
jgi:2',3'-cyclic-nucleotide 2'-phosphodiesterase (5'-nucleotidase family)